MNCQNTYCHCKNKIKNRSINEESLKNLKGNSIGKINYCKLHLFEKIFLIKSLGDPRK